MIPGDGEVNYALQEEDLISYLCTMLPVEFHGEAPLFLLFEDWEELGGRFMVEGFSITSYSEIKASGKVASTGAFAEHHFQRLQYNVPALSFCLILYNKKILESK